MMKVIIQRFLNILKSLFLKLRVLVTLEVGKDKVQDKEGVSDANSDRKGQNMTQNQIAYQANLIKEREADTKQYSADTERFEAGRKSDLIDAQISQIILEYGDIVSKDYKHDPNNLHVLAEAMPSNTLGQKALKSMYTTPYRQQAIDTQREGNILNFLGGLFSSGAKIGSSAIGKKK